MTPLRTLCIQDMLAVANISPDSETAAAIRDRLEAFEQALIASVKQSNLQRLQLLAQQARPRHLPR